MNSTRQAIAVMTLMEIKGAWEEFCIRVLSEPNVPGTYTGEKRVVKAFGDAFIQTLERYVDEL